MPKGSADRLRVELASGAGWVELAVCADWFTLDPGERDVIFAIADRMRGWEATGEQQTIVEPESNIERGDPTPDEAPAQVHTCPECGRTFGRAQALSGHLRWHRNSTPPIPAKARAVNRAAETPANPPTPLEVLRTPTPTIAGKHFACNACDEQTPTISVLRAHVLSVHRRDLIAVERSPVADDGQADEADAS